MTKEFFINKYGGNAYLFFHTYFPEWVAEKAVPQYYIRALYYNWEAQTLPTQSLCAESGAANVKLFNATSDYSKLNNVLFYSEKGYYKFHTK